MSALALALLLTLGVAGLVAADAVPQLRLADDLDRPGDGYCLDVVGVGASARADLPLVAHNCLTARGSVDRMAVLRGGRIEMPAFGACVTAFGVVAPLPGAPLLLRPCGVRESFLLSGDMQRFDHTEAGQLRLAGSTLCLTVGADAAPTFSSTHRWRVLTMERCAAAPRARSVWLKPQGSTQ